MNAVRLLQHYEQIADAPDAIARLRRFILDLAIRGKLVPQDPADEPAKALLARVVKERSEAVRQRRASRDEPSRIEEGQEPFLIPEGWRWARLGHLADLIRGISFPASDKATAPGPDLVPCFRSGNIQSEIVWRDFIYVPFRVLKSDRQLVAQDDILISIANSYDLVGKCAIVKSVQSEATFGAFLAAIRLHGVSPDYVRHFLSSDFSAHRFRVGSSQTTNIANITFGTIRDHFVPLPPLAEQHRIVAKIEELMALCDELEAARAEREAKRDRLAAASLARLNTPDPETFRNDARFALEALPALTARPNQIKQLRQAILNLAVRGKLVPQDPADEPAAELLKRIAKEKARLVKAGETSRDKPLPPLTEADATFELPRGWELVRLGHLSRMVTSGSRDWAKYYANEGAIFVRMGNLSKDHYHLRLDHIQHVKPPADGEGTRTRLAAGDILISITGEVGMLGLIPEGFGEAYINQHTAMVRPTNEIKGRYLPELFRSPFAQTQFNEPQRGIKNSFRLTDITQFIVPLPPLAEQHRIVAKVDELMELCDQLETSLAGGGETRKKLLDALLAEALAPVDAEALQEAAE